MNSIWKDGYEAGNNEKHRCPYQKRTPEFAEAKRLRKWFLKNREQERAYWADPLGKEMREY